ncbi:MAG: NFACT family protein [Candidatus Woesearchaeota archaeon]
MSLSSLDIHYLLKELEVLVGARVDKIYHPAKKELVVQLYQRSKGTVILRFLVPEAFYLTEYKQKQQETPSGFCNLLRKHLQSSRLKALRQFESERIVELVFEKGEIFRLIFELFSKGNIVLCREDYTIIAPVEVQKWKARIVQAQQKYDYPKKEVNLLQLEENSLNQLFEKSNKSVVKTLAIDLGLGGLWAEELCLRAKVDKNLMKLGDAELKRLYTNIKEMVGQEIAAGIVYEGQLVKAIIPFLFKSLGKAQHYASFNEAISEVFTKGLIIQESAELTSQQTKRVEKLQLIVQKQEEHVVELKAEIELATSQGNAFFENYQLIIGILEEITKISKSHSWEEIAKRLKGHSLIKEVNPKEKSVLLELK